MDRQTRTQLFAISMVLLYMSIMIFSGVDTITGAISSSSCGNNVCEVEESIASCPDDCVATCGDDKCEAHETYTCVIDCAKARTAKIEEKAYFVGAVWITFAASIAVLFIAVALMGKPRKVRRRRRKKRRASRR